MKKDAALKMDSLDQISWVKNEFEYGDGNKSDKIYFCGNSLGLQHKSIKDKIDSHLKQWKNSAVESHFSGEYPWIEIQDKIKFILKDFLGCTTSELAIMNALTVNLHLLMVSFYNPSKRKTKIMIENHAFSSDRYVVNSHLKLHHLDESSLILIEPKNNILDEDEIVEKIEKNKDELNLVLLPGIQYYSGQLIDIKKISNVCRKYNIILGVDFAHAIGNVPINLSELQIDFASWCSYKYLNSGPGGISGIYVNAKHFNKVERRLDGWWGNKLSTRFEMKKNIDSDISAEGWVISNPPVILLDIHLASLEIFKKVGLKNIFNKSKSLTKFLYDGLINIKNYSKYFDIITPENPAKRGAQLSLYFHKNSENIFKELNKKFVIDFRKPNVLRVAPVPLYNSYKEVYHFVKELDLLINS
ncbi:MAG: kynureninase [Cytophagales bacterium]|tara:strand:- start:195 stop:1439 length:1245 start_codon:yes stop_codon:yes gene_type:complete